jgi:hypothetical protein
LITATTIPSAVDSSVVIATEITAAGSAQQMCDTAEHALDVNHYPWTTSVLSDRTLTVPTPARWLFCQGDPAGGIGVVAMSSDLDGKWWAASVAAGPLFHAGDGAVALVVDAEVARVVTDMPVGESTVTATTNDGGRTWTLHRSRLETPPRTSAPSRVTVIDEQLPALPAGPQIYDGPSVVSQGPAAAFVPGAGVVGTIGGDADRHFDLAIVDRGTPRRIGVRVQFTPVLAGGPDGRLYVNDQGTNTFSAGPRPSSPGRQRDPVRQTPSPSTQRRPRAARQLSPSAPLTRPRGGRSALRTNRRRPTCIWHRTVRSNRWSGATTLRTERSCG